MADPSYVQLPSGAADNVNKIRTFSLVDSEGNTVLEQVAALADADGNLVGVSGRSLMMADRAVLDELQSINENLRWIVTVLLDGLRPRSNSAKYPDLRDAS